MIDPNVWELLKAIVLVSPMIYATYKLHHVEKLVGVTSKTLDAVVHNTNGMSQTIATMARAAGRVEGQEAERVIGADKAAAVAEAIAAKTDVGKGP